MTVDLKSLGVNEYGLTEEDEKDFAVFNAAESEYSSKSDFSKAMLAFECFKKVFNLRAVEMRKGYYNYTYLKDGNELKTWVPDSRKEFISSVKALLSILAPELNRNDVYTKRIDDLQKSEAKIWTQFAYKELVKDTETGGYKPTGVEFMPEPDTIVILKQGDKYNSSSGGWDLKIEHYWNALVQVYDNIFSVLNFLINDNNYFKGRTRVG